MEQNVQCQADLTAMPMGCEHQAPSAPAVSKPVTTVKVVCGSTPGILDVSDATAVSVTCLCTHCNVMYSRDNTTPAAQMTPAQFERHAGKGGSKKWKESIKVDDGSNWPVQRWLQIHCPVSASIITHSFRPCKTPRRAVMKDQQLVKHSSAAVITLASAQTLHRVYDGPSRSKVMLDALPDTVCPPAGAPHGSAPQCMPAAAATTGIPAGEIAAITAPACAAATAAVIAPLSSSIAVKPKTRRARVLREGELTMIVYGANEKLLWVQRVDSFLTAAR